MDVTGDPVVVAAAGAVAATAHPLMLAAHPDLADGILASMRSGISIEDAQWWARVGQVRVVGNVVDDLQCEPVLALWCAAAAMHARIITSQLLAEGAEIEVARHATWAVVWYSGSRSRPPHMTIGDDDDCQP